MKVYINGKYTITRMTGVQRVAAETVAALREFCRSSGDSVELITPPRWMSTSRFRPIWSLLWEQLVLPLRCRGQLLLSLGNTGPILKKNHAIVLHDAAVFDMPLNYGRKYVQIQSWLMRMHARRARAIFTVSEFSRGRLAYWLHISLRDIKILGVGVEHIRRVVDDADDRIFSKLLLEKGKYILAIGSRQPGKNFSALVSALEQASLSIPLVIVGGVDSNVFRNSARQDGRFIAAGYVSDAELIALLKNTRAYIQPSLYEGFGLPMIEAMAVGVPVICSRTASLPEVCRDAALYFDPSDPQDIARAISAFLETTALATCMGERGRLRSNDFSWRSAASVLMNDLKSLTR